MKSKIRSIFLSSAVLGGFAVSGVTIVALTHGSVDGRIAANQYQAMRRQLDAILPIGEITNDPLADRIQVSDPQRLGAPTSWVYRARRSDQPAALIIESVVPDGYAGPIKLLISVLADGTLGGVRVLSHHETPGLGDKIEETKSDWILGFTGKSLTNPPLDQWAVKRDGGAFDQFTGATITPRSVVKAVRDTLIYVQQQGPSLYALPQSKQPIAARGQG
ncbi:electron transport complex subunit RsxG [Caldichromatium japonicum]|uniref:Ion-translocating oxidoreductase complex subunit G n=1 Tax=Caldichromatium japonicum TaxID=2699430 RepID=A0A6G7VCX7_9GAMM|nr:electron transport complex subunit RsxG [Caldichromatium japonicum]QIK37824.1 electron transport complex subunit RsxG [Caldichromatium japonicum]